MPAKSNRKKRYTFEELVKALPDVPREIPDPITTGDLITHTYNFRPSTWAKMMKSPPVLSSAEQSKRDFLSNRAAWDAWYDKHYRNAEKHLLWPKWYKEEAAMRKAKKTKEKRYGLMKKIAAARGMTQAQYKKYLEKLAKDLSMFPPPPTTSELETRYLALPKPVYTIPDPPKTHNVRETTLLRRLQDLPPTPFTFDANIFR